MLVIVAFASAATLTVGIVPVYAQASRTWVSGVGDDANPCSRTAPCKTFAGAISKTAAGGEIDVLDPGGFGAVTITKSITIDGGTGAGFASILAAGSPGIVINATVNDAITLRNLSINGIGGGPTTGGTIGINILAAKAVYIENTHVFGFRGTDTATGRGISDTRAAGGKLMVSDSTFTDNNQVGVVVATSGSGKITATFDNVDINGNGIGVSLAFGATTSFNRSNISSNNTINAIGIAIQSNGSELNLNDCLLAGNGLGVAMLGGAAVVRMANTMIVDNSSGVLVNAGTVQSWGNNRISGNGSGNTLPPGSVIGQQ